MPTTVSSRATMSNGSKSKDAPGPLTPSNPIRAVRRASRNASEIAFGLPVASTSTLQVAVELGGVAGGPPGTEGGGGIETVRVAVDHIHLGTGLGQQGRGQQSDRAGAEHHGGLTQHRADPVEPVQHAGQRLDQAALGEAQFVRQRFAPGRVHRDELGQRAGRSGAQAAATQAHVGPAGSAVGARVAVVHRIDRHPEPERQVAHGSRRRPPPCR